MSDSTAAAPSPRPIPEGSVVVGLDGSDRDPHVLTWGVEEAVRRGRPLHIVNARESLARMLAPTDPSFAPNLETLRELDELDGSEEIVEAAMSRTLEEHPDLQVSTSRPWGTAVQTLLGLADRAGVIVVGGRRRSAVARFFLGSTALSVAAHAHCPVVVIESEAGPGDRYDKVVVGVDCSSDSDAALEYAFGAAEVRGAELECVTAWNVEIVEGYVVTTPGSPAWDEVESRYRRGVEEQVAPHRGRHPDVKVTVDVVHGPRVATLVDRSETADLVVVGSRGRGGFSGLLLGSVTQGLLQEAHAPVAVITRT